MHRFSVVPLIAASGISTGTLSNQFYRLMTRAGVVPAQQQATGKGAMLSSLK
jgi:hypothetical protein